MSSHDEYAICKVDTCDHDTATSNPRAEAHVHTTQTHTLHLPIVVIYDDVNSWSVYRINRHDLPTPGTRCEVHVDVRGWAGSRG